MVRTGEVVDKESGKLLVVFERPEACERCHGCISKACANIAVEGEAEVGDIVDVALPDKSIVKASALAYLVPLALFVAGMLLGAALHESLQVTMNKDVFAALCGGILLAVGLIAVYWVDRTLRQRQDWQPRVVRVHRKAD